MARETKQHTIDGYTYSINQLGAKVGRRLLGRIVGALAAAASAGEDKAGEKLASALTDEQIDYLCDTLASTTSVSPEGDASKSWLLKDVFDDHFAGRYGAMAKWLWAALETNYSSFLSEFGLDPTALAEKAKEVLSGTPTANPTPQSGALSSKASGG